MKDVDRLLGFIGPSPLPFWIRVSELQSIFERVFGSSKCY